MVTRRESRSESKTSQEVDQEFHMVPFGKFHGIGGAPHETYPNIKYDAPEEVGDYKKCFDSHIRK